MRADEVVGDAVEGDLGFVGGGGEDGEGGAPVEVAGLADGAGIDEVTGSGREGDGGGFGLGEIAGGVGEGGGTGPGDGGTKFVPAVAYLREAPLDVGVAEEGDGGGHLLERGPGVAGGEDVAVLVERGAVGAGDAGFGRTDGALRELLEPGEVFGGELVVGPGGGGSGDGVEAEGGGEAAADAVVIAADDEGLERADAVDDLVGSSAVADEVAEVPDFVVEAFGCGKDGFESFEVGVNVREDESAHAAEIRIQLLAASF